MQQEVDVLQLHFVADSVKMAVALTSARVSAQHGRGLEHEQALLSTRADFNVSATRQAEDDASLLRGNSSASRRRLWRPASLLLANR